MNTARPFFFIYADTINILAPGLRCNFFPNDPMPAEGVKNFTGANRDMLNAQQTFASNRLLSVPGIVYLRPLLLNKDFYLRQQINGLIGCHRNKDMQPLNWF